MTRFVVVGAGAIGGVVGARLHEAGEEVLLVARGAHGRAIAEAGLRVEGPGGSSTLAVPVVEALVPGSLGPQDVVLLATKSQDTGVALEQIVAAGGPEVAVVCAQNGIDNERSALRRFERVYAMLVVVPATHLEPGVVVASAAPIYGVLDVGRYPSGTDETSSVVSAALRLAGFLSDELADPMPWKRGKLLLNLGNALQALAGVDADYGDLAEAARAEGKACFEAAGLEVIGDAALSERARPMREQPMDATTRGGGSSWQSMTRGLSSIEADYLNGEITLLGRLHQVATPVNSLLQRLAGEQARSGSSPGWITPEEIRSMLG